MLLSLPNSGTDWLVGCICRCENLNYYREFFNPIVNPQYEDIIASAFGCELNDTSDMIAAPISDEITFEVLQNTWRKTNFNFTKENYSPFKLRFFKSFFECFVLYRETEMCIPGSRREAVMTWYSSLWSSLKNNLATLPHSIFAATDWAIKNANTINKRQVAAHILCGHNLLQDARKMGVPVLQYNDLMSLPEQKIAETMSGIHNFRNPEKIAQEIVNSRRPRQKNEFSLETHEFVKNLILLLKEPK